MLAWQVPDPVFNSSAEKVNLENSNHSASLFSQIFLNSKDNCFYIFVPLSIFDNIAVKKNFGCVTKSHMSSWNQS